VGSFTTIARNVLSRLKRYKMIFQWVKIYQRCSRIIADCHFLFDAHNVQGRSKTRPYLTVYNSCKWWRRKAIHISKCSLLYPEYVWHFEFYHTWLAFALVQWNHTYTQNKDLAYTVHVSWPLTVFSKCTGFHQIQYV